MGIKESSKGRVEDYLVDPREIVIIDGWNSRDDYGDIDSLKQSIIENGLRKPLKGYFKDNQFILTDGHRRFKAIMAAIAEGHDIKTVRFTCESKYANDAEKILTQIIDNDGKPLTPLEQAKTFRKLFNFGWSEEEIAKRTAKSVQTVVNYLELLAAPTEVHQMIASGEVSSTLASTVIRENGDSAVEILTEAVETAKSEGKVKATAKHIKNTTDKPKLKVIVKQIFGNGFEESRDGKVIVSVPTELYEQLMSLL